MGNNEQIEERIKVRILPNLIAILMGSNEKKEKVSNVNIKRTTIEELEQKINAIKREENSTYINSLEEEQKQQIKSQKDIRKRAKTETQKSEIQTSKENSEINTIDNNNIKSLELEDR